MAHKFVLNETGYHGHGALGAVFPEIVLRGFSKAFVVTDANLVRLGVTGKITRLLDERGFPYETFDAVMPKPHSGDHSAVPCSLPVKRRGLHHCRGRRVGH